MNKLLQFYKDTIGLADLTADEQGNISGGVFAGVLKEAMVDNRRLVLPTYEQLRRPDPENCIRLHPLREDVIRRGESKVMLVLRTWTQRRAFITLSALLVEIMTLALDNSKHRRLSPEQMHFLKRLSDVDETALKKLVSVLEASSYKHSTHQAVVISVRRPGARIGVESRRVRRMASISFPLHDRINELYEQDFGKKEPHLKGHKPAKEKRLINDVEVRRSDVALFKVLFDSIIPNPGDREYWLSETDSDYGPTFVAFLMVMRKFAEATNNIAALFENVFDDAEQIKYNVEWVDVLENLNSLAGEIETVPPQSGNEGSTADETGGIPTMLESAPKPTLETANVAQAVVATVAASLPTATQAQQGQAVQVAAQPVTPGVQVDRPNIVMPAVAAPPAVARPMTQLANPAATLAGSSAMSPAFTGAVASVAGPAPSVYKGNRLQSMQELAQEEHRANVQRILDARAAGVQPQQQVQQVQQVQQIMHNGVVYQAVGAAPVATTTILPTNQLPLNQPLTIGHLVPNQNALQGNILMNGQLMNPVQAKNISVFGTTVTDNMQINGGGMIMSGVGPSRLM